MNEILKAADVASHQSDRWLFIATLFVFAAAALWAFRRLLQDREEVLKDFKESRQQYQDTLKMLMEKYSATIAELRVSLDRNTEAMKINNNLLDRLNRKQKENE